MIRSQSEAVSHPALQPIQRNCGGLAQSQAVASEMGLFHRAQQAL
jgi:hypothetical protein